MAKRRKYSAELKAKVALEAVLGLVGLAGDDQGFNAGSRRTAPFAFCSVIRAPTEPRNSWIITTVEASPLRTYSQH